MRLFITLLIAAFVLTVNVNAEQDSTVNQSAESQGTFAAMTKIEGKVVQADSPAEFENLKGLVATIKALKIARSKGHMTKEQLDAKVAILLGDAKKDGLSVH